MQRGESRGSQVVWGDAHVVGVAAVPGITAVVPIHTEQQVQCGKGRGSKIAFQGKLALPAIRDRKKDQFSCSWGCKLCQAGIKVSDRAGMWMQPVIPSMGSAAC